MTISGSGPTVMSGPEGKLNLRAQNMTLFAQMAEGLDEATWKFHLSHGDYSQWLRESIKDEEIAKIVAEIEKEEALSPAEICREPTAGS